jgi:crossover junction endodeoxyribonuclease RusA
MVLSKSVSAAFEIPFPPSVNNYYRNVNGRTIISAKGRQYRQEVIAVLRPEEVLSGRLAIEIEAFPPDRRRRDLDNICKAALDSIQHAGVYLDDSQIDRLLVKRSGVKPGGSLSISITELN